MFVYSLIYAKVNHRPYRYFKFTSINKSQFPLCLSIGAVFAIGLNSYIDKTPFHQFFMVDLQIEFIQFLFVNVEFLNSI